MFWVFRVAALWGAIVGVMLITGCGGSSSGADSGSTVALTKSQFVQQAKAICAKGSEEIHNEAEPFKQEIDVAPSATLSNAQEEKFVTKVVVPSIRKQAEGVAALQAPEGDLATAQSIAQKLEAVATAGEEDPANILDEGPNNALAAVNKVAKASGIEECMQP